MADQTQESEQRVARSVGPALTPQPATTTPATTTRAARIAGVATNLLASGLILILGVVGGQHLLSWWSMARSSSDPVVQVVGAQAEQRKPSLAESSESPMHHLLSFGDYPLLASRTEFTGDADGVLDQLRASCRRQAGGIQRIERMPGPAERQMLARIHVHEPVESFGAFRIYQISEPLPLVVTVIDQPASAPDQVPRVDARESRVVSWGLAFPAASPPDAAHNRWTLFTLSAENPQLGPNGPFREIPVPPDSRRTMSVRAESGAVMAGFRGTGSMRAWQSFYDRELSSRWTPISSWRHDGPTWQRSFTSPRDGRLDVQLIEEPDGSLNGLLLTSPPQGGATEKTS